MAMVIDVYMRHWAMFHQWHILYWMVTSQTNTYQLPFSYHHFNGIIAASNSCFTHRARRHRWTGEINICTHGRSSTAEQDWIYMGRQPGLMRIRFTDHICENEQSGLPLRIVLIHLHQKHRARGPIQYKMPSYQYRKSHWGDDGLTTVLSPYSISIPSEKPLRPIVVLDKLDAQVHLQ